MCAVAIGFWGGPVSDRAIMPGGWRPRGGRPRSEAASASYAAGFVLANGLMTSNQSGEGEIRRNLIEADLVECRE
jgi:hypothetical protein